jgi:hypothetical protein
MRKLRASAAVATFLIGAGIADAPRTLAAGKEGTVGLLRDRCLTAERMVREQEKGMDDDVFDGAYCLGYFSGINDVLAANCLEENYQGKFAATTDSVGQAVRAFLIWADEHPELWGRTQSFALAAIATKLPCQR